MAFRPGLAAGRTAQNTIGPLTTFVSARSGILLDSLFGTVFETGQRCTSWTPRTGGSAFTAGTGTTARPTLVGSNMVFDGVANKMLGSTGFFASAAGYTMVMVGKATGGGIESYMVNAGSTTDYIGLYCRNSLHVGAIAVKTGPNINEYQSAKYSDGWGIYSARCTFANGVNAVRPQRLNGTDLFGSLLGGSTSVAGLVVPSTPVALGGVNASAGTFAAMTVRFIVLFPAELSDADELQLSQLLAAASGTTEQLLVGVPYVDTEPTTVVPGLYEAPSSYARLLFTTDAEEFQLLTVAVTTTIQYTIAYRINGGSKNVVDVGTIAYPLISLGTGGTVKTVELEVGPQSYRAPSPNAGNYLSQIWLPPTRTMTFAPPGTPTRRLIEIGDSINLGQNASPSPAFFQNDGVSMLTRDAYPGRTTEMTAGIYSLKTLSTIRYPSVTAMANALIALADGTVTNELLIQIGTNDFGLSQWALVSDYQTALTQLLTLVAPYFTHVFVQTLGPRTDISTNGLGQTFAQFVTAQTNAVASVGRVNVTIISGASMYSTGDLAGDGLHLTTSGQSTFFTNRRAAIGY